MRFQEAAWGEPHVAWELILAILDADNSMKVVANLAAGPLEELLATHSD